MHFDAHKLNMENMWKNSCQQIFNLPIKNSTIEMPMRKSVDSFNYNLDALRKNKKKRKFVVILNSNQHLFFIFQSTRTNCTFACT